MHCAFAHRAGAVATVLLLGTGCGTTQTPSPSPVPSPLGSPAPVMGHFVAPWSTQMTSVVHRGRVSLSFAMTNRAPQPLTVKPWTHPFTLVVSPMSGGPPMTHVVHFPNTLSIPVHQTRDWTVIVPTPGPGWYGVRTSTIGVHVPGIPTWDRTAMGGSWFSPYPAGTLRTKTLALRQTVTRSGYTVQLNSLAMSVTQARMMFQIDQVPYFPTHFTVHVTENGQATGTWGGSQRASDTQPVARDVTLFGSVTLDPIPNTVQTMTVSVANVGVNGSGSKVVAGPWTFRIRFPEAQTP